MLLSQALIKVSAIQFAIIITVSMLTLLGFPMALIAAERISDDELTQLYGGHQLYLDWRCQVGSGCPEHTPCDESLQKCTLCDPQLGDRCVKDYSTKYDPTCTQGTTPCANQAPNPGNEYSNKGYCNWGVCVHEPWPEGEYPNCGDLTRPTCTD